jgi:hypothetical protein
VNLVNRAASAAVLCAALTASLAACNSAKPAASGPASVSPSADPLDGLSGGEIAKKAVANLKQASSVHFTGRMKDSGSTLTMDVTLVSGKGCAGTMTEGKGSFKLKFIGTTVWLNADRAFWTANGGNDPTVSAKVSNKWIKTSKSSEIGSTMSDLCNLNKLLFQDTGDLSGMRKGGTSTVNGQPALQLKDTGDSATMEVSETADPRLLSMTDPGSSDGGTFTFTDYNAPVSLTPPPASETIDGKLLGL